MIGECDKIYDRYLPITKEIIDNDNFNNTFFKYYKKNAGVISMDNVEGIHLLGDNLFISFNYDYECDYRNGLFGPIELKNISYCCGKPVWGDRYVIMFVWGDFFNMKLIKIDI